jgi:hypothetical protein
MIKRKAIMVDERPDSKIIEATCDICGADCMIPLFRPMKSDGDRDEHDINKEFEGMELTATWGYVSHKDGESWEACVCEKCVDEHLSPLISFVKKPYF